MQLNKARCCCCCCPSLQTESIALLGVFEDIIGKVDVKGLKFYLLGDINYDILTIILII